MPSGLFLRRFDQIGAGEEKIRRPARPLAQSAEIPPAETYGVHLGHERVRL